MENYFKEGDRVSIVEKINSRNQEESLPVFFGEILKIKTHEIPLFSGEINDYTIKYDENQKGKLPPRIIRKNRYKIELLDKKVLCEIKEGFEETLKKELEGIEKLSKNLRDSSDKRTIINNLRNLKEFLSH